MTFWYDGDRFEENPHGRPVPLNKEGLRFEATVFTTLRVYGRNLHHPLTQWQMHCDRFTHSIQHFNWIGWE